MPNVIKADIALTGSLSTPVRTPKEASLAGILPFARNSLIAINSMPSSVKKKIAE
jgi:hypothetical protein